MPTKRAAKAGRSRQLRKARPRNFEHEQRAAGIRINAELQVGIILKKQEKAQPVPKGSKRNGEGGKVTIRSGDRTQLKDLGITKNQSADWQRMAKDPEAVRKYIKEETGVPTTCYTASGDP